MPNEYVMKISRLTIDKLGVKLYDKVSAVIAELVSNSYDADATEVSIYAPMGEFLASKAGRTITDKGYNIKVVDNGVGMTPEEINVFFLRVGAERRNDPKRGDLSKIFKRKVMGRKGVGKLAPFGICQEMEIISSGGDLITRTDDNGKEDKGYLTAHLILDRQEILEETDFDYKPKIGGLDNSLSEKTGTTIILKKFWYRKVSGIDRFARQLSQRFGIPHPNWQVTLHDTTKAENAADYAKSIGAFDIETMPNTRINFNCPTGPTLALSSSNPTLYQALDPTGNPFSDIKSGFEHDDGNFYPISGWMAYSSSPYKDDLMAGVRIYCRGKIAAQTNIFNKRAGFTGEHNIRSYLVGELHADWLDQEEDLVQTDRRDILWSHELGEKLQDWGQKVVLKIGKLSRNPMREKTWDIFCEVGNVDEKISNMFPGTDQNAIRTNAKELMKMFGQTIRPDEARDEHTVTPIVQLSLALAPHVTLDEQLRMAADQEHTPLAMLSSILKTARLAELSSFGKIAEDRLRIIDRVESLKDDPATAEQKLQELIQNAPWLINPEWAPITQNQTFNTLKEEFQKYYKQETGESISFEPMEHGSKRPDFVLSNQGKRIEVVEIKRPHHSLENEEMERIQRYHDVMFKFLNDLPNSEFKEYFNSFHITLVCDGNNLSGVHRNAFESLVQNKMLDHISWRTFLLRTKQVHEAFLKRQREIANFVSSTEDQ